MWCAESTRRTIRGRHPEKPGKPSSTTTCPAGRRPRRRPQGRFLTPPVRRLLACSADRTLVLETEGDAARAVLKLFETGSTTDAEREHRALVAAAGAGVVGTRGLERDALTGKPALRLEFVDGLDLDARVAETGPLRATDARRVGIGLARVLARLHGLASASAPSGLVHGDIKPANIVLAPDAGSDPDFAPVVLLDFEHASTVGLESGAAGADGFTGGTHGWSPPEAALGHPAGPSFDVFGIGRTLRFALTGERPPTAPRWPATSGWLSVAAPLRRLVDTCCADQPADRPTAAQLVDALTELGADLGATHAAEATRLSILSHAGVSGADAGAESLRDPAAAAALTPVEDLARRRTRRARHRPELPGDDKAASIATLHALARWLRAFPADPAALRARGRQLQIHATKLSEAPERIRDAERRGAFDEAVDHLETAAACRVALGRLGRIPTSGFEPDNVPPILRTPERALAALRLSVETAAAEVGHLTARLDDAEAALDLEALHKTVEQIAARYGGASEITAACKRRAHEFEFALARIAGGRETLDECAAQAAGDVDLAPIREFVARCEAAVVRREDRTREPLHCRALLRALRDLREEFPTVEDAVETAQRALRTAVGGITEAAWQLLDDAEQMLVATPIPIRPLQTALNRIDWLDRAGILIDIPNRRRSELLDHSESVRARLDRARATRDRLARGAEDALDQGHLTTALAELERAANQFDDDTTRSSDQPIADRYQRARQLKDDVESRLRRNHELAAELRAAADEAAPPSRLEELLRERETTLEFLVRHAGERHRDQFEADLLEVRFHRFEAVAMDGEARWARCTSDAQRVDVAAQTVTNLSLALPGANETWPQERKREAQATIKDWRIRAAPRRDAAPQSPPKRSGGRLIISVVAVLALGVTAWVGWLIWRG